MDKMEVMGTDATAAFVDVAEAGDARELVLVLETTQPLWIPKIHQQRVHKTQDCGSKEKDLDREHNY